MIYADPLFDKEGKVVEGQYRLRQIPEVSGAMVAMDPLTGRVVAMVGGFSFDQSQFNRATQAYRQPGSTFKPLVYSAAIDNGYTPASIMIDGPIEIDQGQGNGVWRPDNFSVGSYKGPITLRDALKQSLNTVTVRLAQDVGMPLIGEYAKRFGVYEELPNYLSYSLGAGETTVMRMVTAYSMFANGGRRVKATLIDRIQDRYGRTIFKHDQRECRGCDAPDGWTNEPEPQLVDRREQVLRPVDRLPDHLDARGRGQGGTAMILREVGKPIAGKTGTTSDGKDVWFVGFSPISLSVHPRLRQAAHSGPGRAGRPYRRPDREGFHETRARRQAGDPVQGSARHPAVRIDAKSGMRPGQGEGGRTILEAFKPGTAPPDNYAVVGVAEGGGTGADEPGIPSEAGNVQGMSPTPAVSCVQEPAGFTSGRFADCALRRRPLHPTHTIE